MCFSLEQLPLPRCTPHGRRTLVELFLYFKNAKSCSQQCLFSSSFICPISCNRSGHNPWNQGALGHLRQLLYPIQVHTGVSEPGTDKSATNFNPEKLEQTQEVSFLLQEKKIKQLNPKSEKTGGFKERNKIQQKCVGICDF